MRALSCHEIGVHGTIIKHLTIANLQAGMNSLTTRAFAEQELIKTGFGELIDSLKLEALSARGVYKKSVEAVTRE